MPRFHFIIQDGCGIPGEDGCILPDRAAACQMAIEYAGAVMQSEAERIVTHDRWRMDVTDETGHIVFRLDLSLSEAPAHHDTIEIRQAQRACHL